MRTSRPVATHKKNVTIEVRIQTTIVRKNFVNDTLSQALTTWIRRKSHLDMDTSRIKEGLGCI